MSTVAFQDPATRDAAVSKLCEHLSSAENRAHTRHPFLTQQKIAPFFGDSLPGARDVRQVQCLDISSGGFSYIAEAPPNYQRLVVAFGDRPNLTCMTAEVVQVCEVDFNGHSMYRVGCQFTARLSRD
jgi:hypothetical protein